jgi:hypothetical protein
MTQPYAFDIETLLTECRPASLLVIGGDGAGPAVESYREQIAVLDRECRVDHVEPDQAVRLIDRRYDMGIVTDAVEHLEKKDAIRLLSRLRDLYTRRFCAAIRVGDAWPSLRSTWARNELLALGMMLVNIYPDEQDRPIHLYKYDIATYKPTPRWLNPDDWANPDLWDKYRW